MKLDYLTLDIIILLFPFLLSFYWKFRYYKFYKPLFGSIAIVGTAYIIWDVIVTWRGDWWFNKEFLIGIEILGLPLEEILFFIVVPYSCIFIYENLNYFIGEKPIPYSRTFYTIIAIIFIIVGLLFYYQDYTILAMMSCAAFFLIATYWYPKILQGRLFYLYILLSFVPFIIFNYLLTSTVIVYYNPEAIWGSTVEQLWVGRFITIPFEDFFYNFSMLGFYLLVYVYLKERWHITDTKTGTKQRSTHAKKSK